MAKAAFGCLAVLLANSWRPSHCLFRWLFFEYRRSRAGGVAGRPVVHRGGGCEGRREEAVKLLSLSRLKQPLMKLLLH